MTASKSYKLVDWSCDAFRQGPASSLSSRKSVVVHLKSLPGRPIQDLLGFLLSCDGKVSFGWIQTLNPSLSFVVSVSSSLSTILHPTTRMCVSCSAEPGTQDMNFVLKQIYVLYTDCALKDPFYELEMPIRCELFTQAVDALIDRVEKNRRV